MIKRTKANLLLLVIFTASMCIWGAYLIVCTFAVKLFVCTALVVICTITMMMAFYTYMEILIKMTQKEKRKNERSAHSA